MDLLLLDAISLPVFEIVSSDRNHMMALPIQIVRHILWGNYWISLKYTLALAPHVVRQFDMLNDVVEQQQYVRIQD